MSVYSIPPLISAILFILLGIFALCKSRKSVILWAFFLTSFVTFWWQFSWFILFNTKNPEFAATIVRIGYIGITFIPASFFHFYSSHIGDRKNLIWIWIYYSFAFIFLILLWTTNLYIKGFYTYSWGFYPKAGLLHPVFLFYLIVVAAHSLWSLVGFGIREKWNGVKAEQSKYLILSFIIYCFASYDFIVNYGFNLYPMGFFPILMCLCIVSYTIVKHRLLDIKLVITRAGTFVSVYTLVLGIPFGLAIVGREWLIGTLGIHWFWVPMISLLIFATAGPFIYILLQRKVEARILENEIRNLNLLGKVSSGMTMIKDQDKLIKLVIRVMSRTLFVRDINVYLREEDSYVIIKANSSNETKRKFFMGDLLIQFLKNKADVLAYDELHLKVPNSKSISREEIMQSMNTIPAKIIIPFFLQESLNGFITLGERKNSEVYSDNIISSLRVLGNQFALALENCQFLEADHNRMIQEGAKARRDSLDMMVSTMAHEIDNPITSVICHSELVRESINDVKDMIPEKVYEEIIHSSEIVKKDAFRVSKIIKAVEDYSKGGDGNLKKMNLSEVFETYHTILSLLKKKNKGINYSENIEENLPNIFAEPILIEEILVNFAENAFHAVQNNEDRNKDVCLTIYRTPEEYIRIAMKDNGYGISSKVKKQLFEVPTTTKGSTEGTGIGLYRVRQICGILNAEYGAISEGEGMGAVLYVELPIYKETEVS